MGEGPRGWIGGRAMHAAALSLALLITPAACAAPTHYMGIPLASGPVPPTDIQAEAQRALAGDKQAQLALGIRYEEGNGVPVDLKRARKLYRLAATTTGGTIYVYVPATTKGGKGYVTPVSMGPRVEGLVEARERLGEIGTTQPKVVTTFSIEQQIRDLLNAGMTESYLSSNVRLEKAKYTYEKSCQDIAEFTDRQLIAEFACATRSVTFFIFQTKVADCRLTFDAFRDLAFENDLYLWHSPVAISGLASQSAAVSHTHVLVGAHFIGPRNCASMIEIVRVNEI